jgi:ABC-type proline/glycine betaine transport system ATPase subunit
VTHNVDEGLAVASQVIVMIAGRVVRRDPRAGLDARAYAAVYRALVLEGRDSGLAPPMSMVV